MNERWVEWSWRWRSVGRSGWLSRGRIGQAVAVAACLRCGWSSADEARGAGRTAQRWPAGWPGGVSMLLASLPVAPTATGSLLPCWPPWAGVLVAGCRSQPAWRAPSGQGPLDLRFAGPSAPCQAGRQRDPGADLLGVGPRSGQGKRAGWRGGSIGGRGRVLWPCRRLGGTADARPRRVVHQDPAWKERTDVWMPTLRQRRRVPGR